MINYLSLKTEITNPVINSKPNVNQPALTEKVLQSQHLALAEKSAIETTSPLALPTPRTFIYSNGLTLIVEEDANASEVNIAVYCTAGSSNEKTPGSGLAHFLEHMLLRTTYIKFESDPRLQDLEGLSDASTAYDYTVYTLNVAPQDTTKAISVLSDMMLDSELPLQHFESARERVQREISQTSSTAKREQPLLCALHQQNKYGMFQQAEGIKQVTREDMLQYYKQHYVPNNLTFVISGKVNAIQIRDQLAIRFKNYPARSPEPVELRPESSQIKNRTIEHPSSKSQVNLMWEIPDLGHPDRPALEVLTALLKKRIDLPNASSADILSLGNLGLGGGNVLLMSGKSESNQRTQMKASLLKIIQKIQAGEITNRELQTSKEMLTSDKLESLSDPHGRVHDLGMSWIRTHNPNFRNEHHNKTQAVRREDIIFVAKRYLKTENMRAIEINPIGTTSNESSSSSKNTESAPQKIIFPHKFPPLPQITMNSKDVVEITPRGTFSDRSTL